MKKNNFISNKKVNGFTLIELMVTITIIAIMVSLAVFGLPSINKKAQDTTRLSGMRDLQLAIEGYRAINGVYPDAGSSPNYVLGITPGFIGKLPQDSSQSDANGFDYAVSSDKKSYCIAVKNTVFKNSTQPDMVWGTGSWKTCKGSAASTLTF